MKVIVYLLGFGYIVLCTYLILYTRETVDWINGIYNTYQLKYMAAIPVVYGLLFLIPASFTTYPWVFRVIALLSFCEAIVAFMNPQIFYRRCGTIIQEQDEKERSMPSCSTGIGY